MQFTDIADSKLNSSYQKLSNSPLMDGQSVICGVGSAFPEKKYTQNEVKQLLGINNPTVHKLLRAEHIQSRHLYLPDPPTSGLAIHDESAEELNQKFDRGVLDIGVKAVKNALEKSQISGADIDYLICVTSTGFRLPGISAMISRSLGFKSDLYRLDIVGMGCNAGMTALRTASTLSSQGMVGVVLCCEICSAIYVRDESIRTGVVNSLFGDGATSVVVAPKNQPSLVRSNKNNDGHPSIEMIDFASLTLSDQHEAMRFEWNELQKKWSFCLSKQIPFVVGDNIIHPIKSLLQKNNLKKEEITHWTIHTGGAAVIDGVIRNLNLTEWDLRHTRSVLRDYGNITSGSFLVSLERLLGESQAIKNNDLGVFAAMGPGATLEVGLVRYHL